MYRPEDFVVTEINSKGDLIVLDNFEAPPLPLAPPPSDSAPSPSNSSAESAVIGKKRSSRPDIDSIPPLQDLVNAAQYLSCMELCHTYKTTLEYDPDKQVDLGEWTGTRWVWLEPRIHRN